MSWTPLDLDRQGYDDMVRLALDAVERARDIQAEVAERRAAGIAQDGGVYTDLMVMLAR